MVLDGDVNVRFPLEILPVEASINPEPFKDELAEEKKASNDNYAGYVKRPEFELYNVIKDPFEQNNIIGAPQYSLQVAALKKELSRWMQQQGDLGIETEMSVCNRKGFNHRGCD